MSRWNPGLLALLSLALSCGDKAEDGCFHEVQWHRDADGDGYGTARDTENECSAPEGYVAVSQSGDCDDQDPAVHPGAAEVCDGIDNDCANGVDDIDADGDGHLGSDCPGSEGDDCDDADPLVYPGAEEVWYDGIDQDCEGDNDFDAEGDGHDSDEHGGTDCDDTRADVNPDEGETWYDGVDQDCDGASDNDADGDGYDAYGHGGSDCDDDRSSVNPGVGEDDCDYFPYEGTDNDCDGAVDEDADTDGDGYTTCNGDCDDEDPDFNPDSEEIAENGIDEDCDGYDQGNCDGEVLYGTYVDMRVTLDDCDDTSGEERWTFLDTLVVPTPDAVCDDDAQTVSWSGDWTDSDEYVELTGSFSASYLGFGSLESGSFGGTGTSTSAGDCETAGASFTNPYN